MNVDCSSPKFFHPSTCQWQYLLYFVRCIGQSMTFVGEFYHPHRNKYFLASVWLNCFQNSAWQHDSGMLRWDTVIGRIAIFLWNKYGRCLKLLTTFKSLTNHYQQKLLRRRFLKLNIHGMSLKKSLRLQPKNEPCSSP